jgi:hypothetical protein
MESTKTFSKIEDVLKLYPKSILNRTISKVNFPQHPNLKWKGWEQSYATAEATLKYIDRLKTKVYVLIIESNKFKDFVKFDPKGSPKELTMYLSKLDKNIKWSDKEKKEIKNTQWKFMSCILQNEKGSLEDKDKESQGLRHPYHTLLENISNEYKLSNGMYIFSLRDVLLVHKREVYPWINITQKEVKMKNFPSKLLPIFNTTGGKDYWDIPIPNFEDKDYIYGKKPDLGSPSNPLGELNLDWDSKTPTAVFRGSASGCGYTVDTNPRIKISKISQILQDKDNSIEMQTLLDAGLTSKSLVRKYRFHKDTGLGYFNFAKTGLKEAQRLNKSQQSDYKYLVYIEGNVGAHRLATDMLMKSTILHVESQFTLWFEHLLKNEEYFIYIKEDLSDLIEKILWCRENDDYCKELAEKSRKFALSLLTPKKLSDIFVSYINF